MHLILWLKMGIYRLRTIWQIIKPTSLLQKMIIWRLTVQKMNKKAKLIELTLATKLMSNLITRCKYWFSFPSPRTYSWVSASTFSATDYSVRMSPTASQRAMRRFEVKEAPRWFQNQHYSSAKLISRNNI